MFAAASILRSTCINFRTLSVHSLAKHFSKDHLQDLAGRAQGHSRAPKSNLDTRSLSPKSLSPTMGIHGHSPRSQEKRNLSCKLHQAFCPCLCPCLAPSSELHSHTICILIMVSSPLVACFDLLRSHSSSPQLDVRMRPPAQARERTEAGRTPRKRKGWKTMFLERGHWENSKQQ